MSGSAAFLLRVQKRERAISFRLPELARTMPHFFCVCKRNPAERKHDQEGDTTLCPPLNDLPPCTANLSSSARLARGICADAETAAAVQQRPPTKWRQMSSRSCSALRSHPRLRRAMAQKSRLHGVGIAQGEGHAFVSLPFAALFFRHFFSCKRKEMARSPFCTRKRNAAFVI